MITKGDAGQLCFLEAMFFFFLKKHKTYRLFDSTEALETVMQMLKFGGLS